MSDFVKYTFKEYDAEYPILFRREKERIAGFLGDCVHIEHIGSTSVPSLGGKGVIDMYIIAPDHDLIAWSSRIQSCGYEFRQAASTADRLFHKSTFPCGDGTPQMYQIHLAHISSKDFVRDLAFRDWLIANPADRLEYEQTKRDAFQQSSGDPEEYKSLKTDSMIRIRQRISAIISDGQNKRLK